MRRILKTKLRQLTSKVLPVILFAVCGLASCTYYTNDYDPLEVPEDLGFEEHIIPIFELSCNNAGCHSGAIPPDLQRDVAYKEIKDGEYVVDVTVAENNILYQKIDGGSMDVYATDLDRAYIKAWIEDGALDN